jgi:hypothetical protein
MFFYNSRRRALERKGSSVHAHIVR